jgi:hypothetical protein
MMHSPSVTTKRSSHKKNQPTKDKSVDLTDIADELDYTFDPKYQKHRSPRNNRQQKMEQILSTESDRNIPYSNSKTGRMFTDNSYIRDPRKSSK